MVVLNITLLTVVQQTLGPNWLLLHNILRCFKFSSCRTKEKCGDQIHSGMATCCCNVTVANMEHNDQVNNAREKKKESMGFCELSRLGRERFFQRSFRDLFLPNPRTFITSCYSSKEHKVNCYFHTFHNFADNSTTSKPLDSSLSIKNPDF